MKTLVPSIIWHPRESGAVHEGLPHESGAVHEGVAPLDALCPGPGKLRE